jgi:hypothetical protein
MPAAHALTTEKKPVQKTSKPNPAAAARRSTARPSTFVHATLGIALLAGPSLNAADSFVQNAEQRQRIEQALPTKAAVPPSTSRVRPESVSFNHPDEIIRGQGFMVLADRRVFVVMAFLNAVGLDEEIPGKPMHPVRVRVRELVTANLASCSEKVESWRRHYETHKLPIYCYQDFALSLSADYPFRRIRPDAELGYAATAGQLRDFPEILNDFWRAARVDEVWQCVQPDYAAELRKYDFTRMGMPGPGLGSPAERSAVRHPGVTRASGSTHGSTAQTGADAVAALLSTPDTI